MANAIKVNTDSLGRSADQVSVCIRNLKKHMTNLRQEKQEIDRMWDGDAGDAFKAAFDEDIEALDSFIQNLEKINEYENTAKEKYEKCEMRVGELVNSLRV